MPLTYVKGDATNPSGSGSRIIVHCCNDIGAWGAGFVLALSKKWEAPERQYKLAAKKGLRLGDVEFVPVSEDIVVANLVGQKGLVGPSNPLPVRYSSIALGLTRVAEYARKHNSSVHMPRIGCGLAGGSWTKMEPLILEALPDISVTVYDL